MSFLDRKISIRKSVFIFIFMLLMITFVSLSESRPNSSQSRNLITIIPGGTKRINTLPDANFLISSPSEQYPKFRKQSFFKQSEHYTPSYLNIETSDNADSALHNQHIPLYRDEGTTSSFSKRYLMAETSSSGYSSKGDYSKQPQNYGGGYGGQVIPAAVQSKHQVSYYDVPSTSEPVKPTTVEVGASSVPLNILFRSASSNLNIQQAHEGSHGTTQETESQDEPHFLKHQVTKPIIQHVREIITPIRYIKQELLPVQETIETVIARENGKEYSNPNQATEYAGSRNQYQADQQRHEPRTPTIVTSSVQHLVQAPEYQQPSSQVAFIANSQEAVQQVPEQLHNSYQPETIAINRRSLAAEEEDVKQQQIVPKEATTVETEFSNDYQQHQQQLIDQIGHEYMAASSSALLSSVYGVSASTLPSSGSGTFRHQFLTPVASNVQPQQISTPTPSSIQLNEYTAIDAGLVNQYLPLVYEVINSMEREESGNAPMKKNR